MDLFSIEQIKGFDEVAIHQNRPLSEEDVILTNEIDQTPSGQYFHYTYAAQLAPELLALITSVGDEMQVNVASWEFRKTHNVGKISADSYYRKRKEESRKKEAESAIARLGKIKEADNGKGKAVVLEMLQETIDQTLKGVNRRYRYLINALVVDSDFSKECLNEDMDKHYPAYREIQEAKIAALQAQIKTLRQQVTYAEKDLYIKRRGLVEVELSKIGPFTKTMVDHLQDVNPVPKIGNITG